MYIKVIPDLAKISKKWTKVKEHNFSTYKHEAHKVYANTLRNLLTSEKKLVNMVEQERAEMYPSDTEEEAEEEMSLQMTPPSKPVPRMSLNRSRSQRHPRMSHSQSRAS